MNTDTVANSPPCWILVTLWMQLGRTMGEIVSAMHVQLYVIPTVF